MPRRQVLGALATGALGGAAGLILGSRTARAMGLAGDGGCVARKENTLIAIDFAFNRPVRAHRSRVVLHNRGLGKIGLTNGRRIGVVPGVLEARGQVELSVYDVSGEDGSSVFLKRVVLPASPELRDLGIPDTLGLAVAPVSVINRELSLSNGGQDPCDEEIRCCVQCDEPPADPTCGSAVCCDTQCQDPGGCGSCCCEENQENNCEEWCLPIIGGDLRP